jgi:hypothetical protein
LNVFAVLDVMPMDRKAVKAQLQRRGIGRLEVKKRGVDVDPDELRKSLAAAGDETGVLIVAPGPRGKTLAFIARRC